MYLNLKIIKKLERIVNYEGAGGAMVALFHVFRGLGMTSIQLWPFISYNNPVQISLTERKGSTLVQMVYMGPFCSYNDVPNQAFL